MKDLDYISSVWNLEPGDRPVMKCDVCGHVERLSVDVLLVDEFLSKHEAICDVCRSFNNATIFIRPLPEKEKR